MTRSPIRIRVITTVTFASALAITLAAAQKKRDAETASPRSLGVSPEEPPLYISREEGNSSSQSLPSAENSNAEPSAS